MSAINFHTKEISVKIVYYGPGLCGKTTSLQAIFKSLPEERRNQFVSLATEVDRTIFFDFLPVTVYKIRDFTVRQQLYTVPGQVFYNATRKLVLNGVDGVVFVVDSQRTLVDANQESLQNLADNLRDLGMDVADVPMVLQANKRDLADVLTLEEVDALFNPRQVPVFGTVATTGEGVAEALKTVSQLVVNNLLKKGLGRRVLAPDNAEEWDNEAATGIGDGSASIGAGLSATVAAAAAAAEATRPATRSAASGWWPDAAAAKSGRELEEAMAAERFAAAVLAAEKLVQRRAEVWAREVGYAGGGPVPAFLWLRGADAPRYRVFAAAVAAARAGRPVSRADAMAALILTLQSVW